MLVGGSQGGSSRVGGEGGNPSMSLTGLHLLSDSANLYEVQVRQIDYDKQDSVESAEYYYIQG